VTTERNPSVPGYGGHPANHRKAIPAACRLHQGPVGYVNLMVSKHNGTIVLDPHVTDWCVISLDEEEATTLRDLLIAWLR
jgi:hypothetical protein